MSKDIKKALEHCIEWDCVDCPNREELGSGEIVCRGRLLTDVLEYVTELEAKLAERTKQLKIALKDFNDIQQENDKLAQQLAEKEKKIESCNHTIYMNMLNQEMLQLKVANLEQSQNQTAIAELEKVKKFLLEKIAEKQSCFDSGNYNDFADGVKTICELILISIDKQIKSLKGENNGRI